MANEDFKQYPIIDPPPDAADYLHGDMPKYEDGQWTIAGKTTNVNALEPFPDYYELDEQERTGLPPGYYDEEEEL